MIVELFGPPGAGKTTFAHMLAAGLRERGHGVELILSYRPAEPSPSVDADTRLHGQTQVAALINRLTRPAVEMLTMAHHPTASLHALRTAADLLRVLPPKSLIWSIRLRQYIIRLSHAWQHQSQARHIVVFDQAFIQLLCSLALLAAAPAEAAMARALDCIPMSDVLIRIDAPGKTLEGRLRERECRQGPIEWLLELDVRTSLESVRIIGQLDDLLARRGRAAIAASSLDRNSLDEVLASIERQRGHALHSVRVPADDRYRPQSQPNSL